jgi:hypothetical protein
MYLLLYLVTAHGLDRHSRQHQLTRPSPTASIDARLLRQIRNSAARTRKPGETVWVSCEPGLPGHQQCPPGPGLFSYSSRAPTSLSLSLSLSAYLNLGNAHGRSTYAETPTDSAPRVLFLSPTIVRFRSKLPP